MGKKLIELKNVTKIYDDVPVVNNLNLYINENEFITLLGPSGCGKTTTLRMIGGFEKPDSGDIILNGVVVTELPPYERPINTVFQRYALFPHLNVFDNIAFGLRSQKVKKEEITVRVEQALKMVSLPGFGMRKVQNLSGGQQQRVAIARAIVNQPKILLLDEPLAALDLKLRQNMQYELKEMQRKLGITFIYVTHDQEEALTMSDTIVVMKDGLVQQIGTPFGIYNEPKNRFVANFIGESNIFEGVYLKQNLVQFMDFEFACVDTLFADGEKVDVVIRPEDFDIISPEEALLKGKVTSSVFKGVHFELCIMIQGKEFVVHTYENRKVDELIGLKVDPYEIHLMKVVPSEH
ncbi:MAG: ABC transporter ATP-binding protein [Firmicutes bacterium]|nr:ABC transporter ATP-binding protein [Bacillota bacterium]